MTIFKTTATSAVALSLCLSGSAAFADVTAQDVWQDWRSYMEGFGYTLDGTESRSGDTLTISDLTMTMEMPEEAGTVSLSMSEFMFTDNGDGTVTMTLPPTLPVRISVDSPDAEDVDMSIDYITDDFAMVASGDSSALNYAYTADALTIMLKELVVEGEAVEFGTAQMNVDNLAGSSAIKVGDLRNIVQTISTGKVSYDMDFVDPEGSGRMVINGSVNSTSFEGSGDYASEMDMNDMAAMMEAGFAFDGSFTHDGSQFTMDFDDDGEQMQINSQSGSGLFRVAMGDDGLLYDIATDNLKMTFAGAELPFPVDIAMEQSGFKLLAPVSKSEEPQDFALALTLGDFTVSDAIWGMIDPAGQLPRDPATIALDLTGKASLFFNLFDPEEMEEIESGETMPGELNSLTLNALTVRAAGAELTGDGAFTFDNSDMVTFSGMPAPDGAVDLSLTGGNALLDKLVAMGLLPEEQAMGARMMMGLFAVPGAGEDNLTSKIEVKPDGQILANGQRLQ